MTRLTSNVSSSLRNFLPRGGSLPYAQWQSRHRVIVAIVWCHALGLAVFGVLRGEGIIHSANEGAIVAGFALLASWKRLNRSQRSVIAAVGLVSASAVLVHLSGGVIETHFHFFIMVAILSLYEDWLAFLVAIGFVVLHHGITGWLSPESVYNHYAAVNNPWKWAAIHGTFVLGASVANLVAWRKNEELRADLQQSLNTLSASEERFRTLVQNASDIAILAGRDGTVQYISPSVEGVMGYDPTSLLGETPWGYIHPEDLALFHAAWEAAVANEDSVAPIEYRARHASGEWRWLELTIANLLDDPAVGGMVCNLRDVTDRKAAEEAMIRQAFHDALTGLPNRALFLDRLGQALARSERRGSVAVLFLDLDRFKWINDSLGHAAGDALLVQVAGRLRYAVRPGDSVARFGGDEFVVLCELLEDEHDAVAVAGRLTDMLKASFTVEGREITVTSCIGIASTETTRTPTPSALLRDADAAMYRAKELGRDRVEVFHHGMRKRAVERLELETALRVAIDHRELRVYYQPIVRVADARMVGVEALVRWQHPERGLIAPDEFIPVAEETGLIVPLGKFVLNTACAQIADWNRRHPDHHPLNLAVNLSAGQLGAANLTDLVASALESSGLPAPLLSVEITESVLMQDVTASHTVLRALKDLGVRIGIDDFGTGYSSLLYLRRFPVDFLKVDRTFVGGLGNNSEDAAIVAGVIGLANALGVEAIAEGVEREGQAVHLRSVGCALAQGYLWSRPLPASELELLFTDLWRPVMPALARVARDITVVLVDDRAEFRGAMRIALELAGGFKVVAEAASGTEAIELATAHQPDFVLLDVRMPQMDGVDALAGISAGAPRAKVVILSADATGSQRLKDCAPVAAMFDKAMGPSRLVQELETLSG